MASENWTASHPLVRRILSQPTEFDFFQLLHLIERVEPDAPQLGHQGPANDETIRLRPALSLTFPPGDLHSAQWQDTPDYHDKLQITLTFLGLYGSDSPLPAHFTESLLAEQEEDERVRAFVDVLHHRVYSLLYRGWKKYRYYVTFRKDGSDPISQVVRGLLGLGTRNLDDRLRIEPVSLFRYAGILSQRPHSAIGLVGQLQDFFDGIDFDIQQCVGRWLAIQPNDRNKIGLGKCTLGQDFLIGERIFDRSGKFRLKAGPVGFDDYVRFWPSGDANASMSELVRFYCDDPFDFDVEVTLRGDEVPETPLGQEDLLGRLSWSTWLKSEPSPDKSVIFSVPKVDAQRP